jgi:ferredoxin-NADP reductase
MIRRIDSILNKITMYRLVLYELIFLLFVAEILAYGGSLPYNPVALAFSAAFLVCVTWVFNKAFAFMFDLPTNPESAYITALILVLIISPPSSISDLHYLSLAFWGSGLAIASKYILAVRGKHVFNPAALGVALTAFTLGQSASWWVGTLPMLLPVLSGGLLLVRKIRRFDLFAAYLGGLVGAITYFEFANGTHLFQTLSQSLLYTPAFFFATVMLTEPLTAPGTRTLRVLYGVFIGFLFAPEVHFGSLYLTPELALLIGNAVFYLIRPKQKLLLRLKESIQLSPDSYEFAFATSRPVSYRPGQYMEWTLGHRFPDSRGARRYFTLASSPTEKDLKLGIKFSSPASSFKKKLLAMKRGDIIIASDFSGDFVLPKDKTKKLVFIAGGIGITPFKSMVKYLLDQKERRDITLLYSNKTPADAAYRDFFDRAGQLLGIRTTYIFTSTPASQLPAGACSALTVDTLAREIPDWRERTFYISGPQGMVSATRALLITLGVPRRHIKTDYFPGF